MNNFIMWNHTDVFYEFTVDEDIPFQAEHCLVFNPEKGSRPWFTNPFYLFCLDLLSIGWIQRLWLAQRTKVVEYALVKYIID